METYQLLVIGGGPGGYSAAFRAADLGLKVALIDENPRLGGVCLLNGCIPSKALLHAARVTHEAREAKNWGLHYDLKEVDLNALRQWKDNVVSKLSGGVHRLAKLRKVRVFCAKASFIDSQTVKLEPRDQAPQKIGFEHAIIATGSLPVIPKAMQADDPRVWDSTSALELREIPKRLLIVGGGYIGLEMGTVYAALGSKVSLAELEGELLMGADHDLVKPLQKRLETYFHKIYLSTRVASIEINHAGVIVNFEGQGVPPQQLYDAVLVAVGRRPNSANLNLESTQVRLDKAGYIEINQRQQTADPHILAIGDAAGQPLLAHKASREGKIAAEVVAGRAAAFDNMAIPAVVFTDPEVAWCGLTENEAKRTNIPVKVARFPWTASGRALTLDRAEGVTKVIYCPQTERVLGVGICGAGAGEVLAEGVLAVEMGALLDEVAATIHTHPTLSETFGEAMEVGKGLATHLHSWRRG